MSSADDKQRDLDRDRVEHEGHELTTDQGIRVEHTDDSLTIGERGPTLIEDFHLREKITRFDHERIPERVVHARGAGAYGVFTCTESLADVTAARFLSEVGRETPVFVRFSTVAGSRGSADTVRDVRGFATKFYTPEGNFDLVGNNMPVFFIQDGIKFPDFVHAVKPEPPDEIPQASSAHDTLWDFVALQQETAHMMMWLMSDRALPRSYRMMQGFGVHTFRFVDGDGHGTFVKFHWRPMLGTHSLVWDEAQKIAGAAPDFNRRDLWEAIERGDYPEWDLAVQLVPEAMEHDFDFDLLDPTKLIPEEEVPLRVAGRLRLDRNPDNYFAETEQVAFHVANVVPGIDFTNDPLLQARLFSYLDTQLIRLGGPNFAQIPVNRPISEVHHHQRDGYGQHRIDVAPVSYHKNSIASGCPHLATVAEGGYRNYAERVDGSKVRRRSSSFQDHFSQATLFWNSMSDCEQDHIADAFHFELGKLERPEIRQRVIDDILVHVDVELAQRVAEGLGLTTGEADATDGHDRSSPALSQENQPQSPKTRKVAILAADGVDGATVERVRAQLTQAGVVVEILAPHGGALQGGLDADRGLLTMASVLYDAVLVAPGAASASALQRNGAAVRYVAEAFKHGKPVGAVAEGIELLRTAPLPGIGLSDGDLLDDAGVVTVADSGEAALTPFIDAFLASITAHRRFDREIAAVPV